MGGTYRAHGKSQAFRAGTSRVAGRLAPAKRSPKTLQTPCPDVRMHSFGV